MSHDHSALLRSASREALVAEAPARRPDRARSLARSVAMQDALAGVESALGRAGGVLLCGEPGVGRGLIARAIHLGSQHRPAEPARLLRRAMRPLPEGRPFVSVDCSDREGLELALFGNTGGAAEEPGVLGQGCALEAAIGGTLYLRHLPDAPPRLQARLARLLADGEAVVLQKDDNKVIRPLGVRPIASADAGAPELVAELNRRISSIVITVPPLRLRREDIPGLVRFLLRDTCTGLGISRKTVSDQALDLLAALPWKGNLTELELLLRRLAMKVGSRQIRLADVLAHVRLDGQPAATVYGGTLREARESFERDYVAAVLDQHRGRMAEAARALGLQRTNLYRKVRQLSVQRPIRRQLS